MATEPDKRRFLVYGPPKSGKTSSLATVPKGARVHLVDLDRQTRSLEVEWRKRGHNPKDLDIVRIDTSLDPTDTSDGGEGDQLYSQIRKALWRPPEGFDFYVGDGWTTLGICLTHFHVGVGNREYNQYNNTLLSSDMNDFFWQFAGAAGRYGAWCVIIMHEAWREVVDPLKDKKDWRNKEERLEPICASSAKTTVPANSDFVFHVEPTRKLVGRKNVPAANWRTRGAPAIMASSVGFDDKLNVTEEADFAKLFQKLGFDYRAKLRKKGKR